MFDLYDIFDDNEINIILLCIFVIILIIIIIGLAYYDYTMKQKLIKVETELKNVSDALDLNLNKNMFSEISNRNSNDSNNSNNSDNYKQKYEELLREKDTQPNPMQYSPSEYATLLKYNPILPYSAFTMDIINNAYLDMNEKGMYEDRYFALSNYDNIYDTTRNNNNNNNIDNSNSKLSSEDQDIVDMAKLSSEQQEDNPNIQTSNNNSVQPNSNSKQSNF